MAKQDVSLLFGVAGGGSISGESGDLIKRQLTNIATSLNGKTNSKLWKITFNLNIAATKKNFSTGLKQIMSTLNGQKQFNLKIGTIDASSAITKLRGELNAMLRTLRVDTGFTVSMGANGAASAVKDVAGASQEAVLSLSQVDAALKEIGVTNQTITKSYKSLITTLSAKGDTSSINSLRNAYIELEAAVNNLNSNKSTASQVHINSVYEAQAAIQSLIASLQRETAAEHENAQATEAAAKAQKSAQKERANSEKAIASMRLQLARFNEYLTTINPKALKEFQAEINNIHRLLSSELPVDAQKAANAITSFKAQVKAAGYESGNAVTFITQKLRSFVGYLTSSMMTMGIYRVFYQLVENVKTLDAAMTDLRIVTGNTRNDTEDLLKSYSKMAQTLGTTTESVATGATDWLRQGYNQEDSEELLTQSMTLSIVGDMESADATDALTAAIKGYGLAVEDASGVVDKFMTVDMAAATSSEDLALALAKTAANAKIAGLSLNDVIGQLAVVNETMKESGEETGRFYNTMLSRMGSIKSGRLVDPETDEDLSDVETTLNRLGIALRGADGDFRNFGEVLDEVGSKWETYSAINQRAIAQSFAGTRQQTRFLSLMEGWAKAAEYSAVASDSAGKSAEKLAIYQESVEAKTARVTASFEELSMKLLDNELVGFFMEAVSAILKFLSLGDAFLTKGAVIITLLVGVKAAIDSIRATNFGASITGTISSLNAIIPRLQLLGTAATTGTTSFAAFGSAMQKMTADQLLNVVVTNNQALGVNKLTRSQINRKLIEAGVSKEVRKAVVLAYMQKEATDAQTAATKRATTATGGFKTALKGLGTVIAAHPIVSAVTAIAAVTVLAVTAYKKHNEAIEESIQKAKELQSTYKENASTIASNISSVEEISLEFRKLSKGVDDSGESVSLSADEYDRYLELVNQLVGINPSLVKGYNDEGQAIIDKNTAIRETIDLLKEQQELELFNATTDDNNWDIAKGLKESYNKAIDEVGQAKYDLMEELQMALAPKLLDNETSQATVDALEEIFGVSLGLLLPNGYDPTGMNSGITGSSIDLLFDAIESKSENATQIVKENLTQIHALLGDSALSASINTAVRNLDTAERSAARAASSYQSHMKLIAKAAIGYDDLTAGSKQFLNTWIETIKLTGDETKADVDQITNDIQSMVAVLGDEELSSLLNAEIDYSTLSGAWADSWKNRVETLLSDLEAQQLITAEQAMEMRVAFGIVFIDAETGEEIDARDYYATQVKKWLDGSGWDYSDEDITNMTLAEMKAMIKLNPSDYGGLDEAAAAAKNAAGGIATLNNSLTDFSALAEHLAKDTDLIYAAIQNLQAGNINAIFEEEALDNLLDKFPNLVDELDAYAKGLLTTEQLQQALNNAIIDFNTDTIYDGVNDVVDAVKTYGAESNQAKQTVQNLGSTIPGLVDALYDEETGLLKVDASAISSETALYGVVDATIAAERAAKNSDFSVAIQNLEELRDKAIEAAGAYYAMRGAVNDDLIDQADAYQQQIDAMLDVYYNGLQAALAGARNRFDNTSSKSDPWLEAFEAEYAAHQHAVNMERETLEDFYAWLESANKKYFKGRTKYLDEYRKYTEEVFNGLRDLADDAISDGEHEIFLWENQRDTIRKVNTSTEDRNRLLSEQRDLLNEIGQKMTEQYQLGNVNLTARPQVDLGDGTYATVESTWLDHDVDGGKVAIHLTPILETGEYLDDSTFNSYINELLDGAANASDILERDKTSNGGLGLVLAVRAQADGQSYEEFLTENNAWGESLHLIQEEYYNLAQSIENFNAAPKHYVQDIIAKNDLIIAKYRELQAEVHLRAEQIRESMRNAGWDEAEIENHETIQELQKQWWSFADAIDDVKQQIVDDLLEVVSATSEAVDSIQNVYDTLHEVADEFAENDGFISVDAFQKIVELGPQYMQYLRDENGLLVINEENIRKVIAAKTQQLALDNAMAYVERLRLALQEDSIEDLNELLYATTAATNSTWDLVYANLALLDLTTDQFQAALHNINAIRAMADNAVMSIGNVTKSLSDTLNEMKDGVDDILKYVMDMIRWEIEEQIEALEDAKDAYADLIDMKKESLKATEDEAEYQDEVAEKVKEIAKLQERINALSLDDSREAQAEKVKLEEEMAELQKELGETQRDHAIELQEESLDTMQENYEKQKDKEIEALEESIDSQEELYRKAIDRIETEWDTLYDQLISWNTNYGNVLNQEITDAWNNCLAAAQRYGSYVSALQNLDADIEAAGTSGTSLVVGNTQQYDTSAAVKALAVKNKINEMKANSAKWIQGDPNGTNATYQARNKQLAAEISTLIGQPIVIGEPGDGEGVEGVWFIGHKGGPKLYENWQDYVYHTGGIAGNNGTLKENELLAKLEDGEAIISNKNKGALFSLIEFVGKLSRKLDLSGISNINRQFGDMSTKLNQVTASNAPSIHFGDVYITGADKSTIEEHRRINREFTNEVIKHLGLKK